MTSSEPGRIYGESNVGQIAIAGGVVAEGTTRTPFHALGTVSGLTDVFILRFGRLSDGRTSARCSESGDTRARGLASTASLAILDRMNVAENNHETTRPGGITGNGFKPGQSGNPGGRPKGLAKTVRDACGGSPLRLAHVLLEIAEDPKAHNRDRVAATRELLDRGWGKAPAYASVQMDDPLELSDIAREIQTIADELAARREAKP